MPKDERKRLSKTHQPSAKIASRPFALPEEQTEKIIHSLEVQNTSANELLRSVPIQPTAEPSVPAPLQTKKDKKRLKHELFLQRLTAGVSPYSKSHNRRLKRKAKSQLSTDFASVEKVLQTLTEEAPVSVSERHDQSTSRSERTSDLIGKGKGVPLSKKQRQKALEIERLRQPAIMQNPEFKSNPFAAIRTHIQNSLLLHDGPENES